jgi:uncharacterized protein (DUF2141 family)
MRAVHFWSLQFLLTAPLAGAGAAELKVTVEDVATGSGHVLVAVCTPETFLRRGCPYTGRAPAATGEAQVVVHGIAPGVYAVQAFHDQNDNFDLGSQLPWSAEGGHGSRARAACRRASISAARRTMRPDGCSR